MAIPRPGGLGAAPLIVAIHQPNYAPWLGYFHKLARADLFVFLDDAQFSKGSYTNRVQILENGAPRWLTVPVRQALGTPINRVAVVRNDWARAHLDTLRNAYPQAAHFRAVWTGVEALYADLPAEGLAQANAALIQRLAERLSIATPTRLASGLDVGAAAGDDRLVAIVSALAPGATYLSGKGGGNYQDPVKFEQAGLKLMYSQFTHPEYDQHGPTFVAGLSILDAVFHLGWERTSALVAA